MYEMRQNLKDLKVLNGFEIVFVQNKTRDLKKNNKKKNEKNSFFNGFRQLAILLSFVKWAKWIMAKWSKCEAVQFEVWRVTCKLFLFFVFYIYARLFFS